jgi:hypothetical protein
MKYAWITETFEDGQEIFEHVVGEEILDVGDIPFDPPQYYEENISFDPPQFTQVPVGGPVTGLNRAGQEGEQTGSTTPQHLVWGMDNSKYNVVANVFTAVDQPTSEDLDAEALLESTMTSKNAERDTEYSARVATASGSSDPLWLQKENFKHLKALRKEAKGTQSQADEDFLDARDILDDELDTLDSKNDALELLIEGSTQAELDILDVTDDIHWV